MGQTKKIFVLIAFLLTATYMLPSFASAARLPNVNGDENTWGTTLNTFLSVSLEQNGTLGGVTARNVTFNDTSNGTLVQGNAGASFTGWFVNWSVGGVTKYLLGPNGIISTASVNSTSIVDASILTADIANSQITTALIGLANITSALIAPNAVTSNLIAPQTINNTHIIAGSVNSSQMTAALGANTSAGSSTLIPSLTVDVAGRVIAIANNSLSVNSSVMTATLASNTSAGNATTMATITVDTAGRVIAVTNTTPNLVRSSSSNKQLDAGTNGTFSLSSTGEKQLFIPWNVAFSAAPNVIVSPLNTTATAGTAVAANYTFWIDQINTTGGVVHFNVTAPIAGGSTYVSWMALGSA